MAQLKVALNISALPVPEKVTQSQTMITNIANNPQQFANPGAMLTNASAAVNNLQAALLDAADGAKSKIAIMHDREDELITAMNRLAAYVELTANGDPAIIHLAGMAVKKTASRNANVFSISQNGTLGMVSLTTEPQDKTLYKWEYCKDPISSNTWIEANRTNACRSKIGSLGSGLYWFRVITDNVNGEHTSDPVMFLVK